ncbi:hypothetical protein C8T65DRAFT_817523 [Cerioporus squamosus]|nr:hypothetical protein C8T65DRAFT_817523 [Cerioporus squamosus]
MPPGLPIKNTFAVSTRGCRSGIHPQEIIEGSVIYPGVSGTFSVLFNARKSPDDTQWQPHGVPAGFRTLDEEFGPQVIDGPREVYGLRGWNCRSAECTREISGGLDVGTPAGAGPTVSAGGGFKLTCRKTSGAVLALAHDTTRTYIESSTDFMSYMSRHHASWLEMANAPFPSGLRLGLNLEDLYFVSGTTKVPQWFEGVFEGGEESERGGHLECTVSDVFNLNAEATDILTVHRSPILKKGPRNLRAAVAGSQLPSDQCIFIHYFKMKRRLLRSPTVLKAAAGPHELPESDPDKESPALLPSDHHGYVEMEVDIEEEPGRRKIVAPVDDLLEYILDHSQADSIERGPQHAIPVGRSAGYTNHVVWLRSRSSGCDCR